LRNVHAGRPLLLLALTLLLTFGSTSLVRADQPTASGTWDLISHTQTLLKTADGNTFYAVVESPAYVGTAATGLFGTAVDTYTLIVHSDGSVNAQGIETCTGCSIGGRAGGHTATLWFPASGPRQEPTG